MLDFVYSLGGFIIAIGVLVAFHEYGHYWVARRCGVKVLRYSIGFGKIIWSRRAADGVQWTLSAIPLGGYVKMLDEREGEVAPELRHLAFNNAPVGRRIAIVCAGPAFNFILAMVFYWLTFVIGIEGMKTIIAEPPARSAAARAGLHQGDQVLRVGGHATPTWTVLRTELLDRVLDGAMLDVDLRSRDGAERRLSLDLSGVRIDPEVLFDDLGLDSYRPPMPAVIGEIVKGAAAEAAGLASGDRVLAVNDEKIAHWQQLFDWVRAHPATVAKIEIERAGRHLSVNAVIASETRNGKTYGRLGAGVAPAPELWQDLRAENRLSPIQAVPAAIEHTWRMSVLTLKMLYRMLTGDISVKNVSGPIQIAQVAGFTAQIGLVSFLSFMAIVSVSLGVLNLMPVPLLDGGHLLYYGIEAVRGAPLSERVQELGQRVGLTMLVMLMGLAFYNDIVRLLN